MMRFRTTGLTAAIAAMALAATAGAALAAWKVPDPSDMIRGKATAPVTIVEYASMGCPHCARLHNEVFPAFKAKYIDTGQVRWISREALAGDQYLATGGVLLARCAGKDHYFDVVDAVYRDQEKIYNDLHDGLLKVGKSVGMTDDQFNACLKDPKGLAELNERLKMDEADKIRATPTLMVNGKIVGDGELDMAALDKIVADARKASSKKPAPAKATPKPATAPKKK